MYLKVDNLVCNIVEIDCIQQKKGMKTIEINNIDINELLQSLKLKSITGRVFG